MHDERPYKVVVRCPNAGQTTYETETYAETYPDIDAMFVGTRASHVAVFWRNGRGAWIYKDSRDKHDEMEWRLSRDNVYLS